MTNSSKVWHSDALLGLEEACAGDNHADDACCDDDMGPLEPHLVAHLPKPFSLCPCWDPTLSFVRPQQTRGLAKAAVCPVF